MRLVLNELNGSQFLLEDLIAPGDRSFGERHREGCCSDQIVKGQGAKIVDIGGNEYLDFCLANGSMIIGHPEKEFLEAVRLRVEETERTGNRAELESNFSETINEAFPSMERSLFLESRNLATEFALKSARLRTGRKSIIKVVSNLSYLTQEAAENTVLVPFNDLDRLCVSLSREAVAAIILEPVPCFPGPIVPEDSYLERVREIADGNGIVLIFDEVTTGFRLAMGGAQERFRVRPDLTILGKVAGGGLPIGICGGLDDLMDEGSSYVCRSGSVPSSVLPVAAGLETVQRLRGQGHDRLNEMGERMGKGLEAVLNEFHVRYKAEAIGSIFQVFLDPSGQKAGVQDRNMRKELYPKVREKLLENKVHFSPLQEGTNFISTAHTMNDIDDTVNAVLVSLGEVAL